MDDIHLEDPRKFSAKKIRAVAGQSSGRRRIWQYLFDLIIKTIICAAFISLDFTLFANSGNYHIFGSSFYLNAEVLYIYIGIAVFSFVIMFAASFFKKLENVVLALCVSLLCIAIINQFASFEKHSGLLILFSGIFSDGANAVLYKYSFWIIGVAVFIAAWLLFNMLKRQFLLYFAALQLVVLGWLLSEAYFSASSQYFRTAAAAPTLKNEGVGKNLIFLSFNSLTSPNNLASMAQMSKQKVNIQETFNNVLGFFARNNFILYPNALVKNEREPFLNLISSYNPDSDKDASEHLQISAIRDEYFIFDSLQRDRVYLKDSSLYSLLRKKDYTINVFQTRGVDVCYLDNKLAAALCKEKINAPTNWNGNNFSTEQKTLLLLAQWLNSTGFVDSLNPVLTLADFVLPSQLRMTMSFKADELYAVNSFKVFDQIIDSLEKQTGNQAYFAIIDLPSETYIYDEFCHLKNMSDWVSENNFPFARPVGIDVRRDAYAEQISCLFGALDNFIRRLERGGYLKDTTLIIQGLNTPQGLAAKKTDYYRQLQQQSQVMLAIYPAGGEHSDVDYSVCHVDEILNSFFFTHKPCKEFSGIKTTDKALKHIRQLIEEDKYKDHIIAAAEEHFGQWSSAWQASNQIDGGQAYQKNDVFQSRLEASSPAADVAPRKLEKPAVAENEVKDVPEQPVKSISAVGDNALAKQEIENSPSEVGSLETKTKTEEGVDTIDEPLPEMSSATTEAQMEEKATSDEEKPQEMPIDESGSPQVVNSAKILAEEKVAEEDVAERISGNDTEKKAEQPATEKNVAPETVEAAEVIPETLFDKAEVQDKTEAAITKAREAVRAEKGAEAEKKLDNLAQDVEKLSQNEELQEVLEAPVAEGENLSPEELKRQFHKNLQQAARNSGKNSVNIEVKVIEN